MKAFTLDEINHLVLRKQHLTDNSKIDDIVQIVKDLSGLHATSSTTPYLSLFARTKNFQKKCLDEELYSAKNLGKIRCMRKTLYILTKDMMPTACAATRKKNENLTKKYAEFRGVSPEKYREISKSILDMLKGKEMTASQIKKILKTQLDVSAILYLMCDQGLLVRSRAEKGWKDKNLRYALFNDYFPDLDLAKTDEKAAMTLLVQYYLKSFGPVTEDDVAWWTGLGKTQVRQALVRIQEQTSRIKISGLKGDFIMFRSDERLPKVMNISQKTLNLLPSLDPYLMGYKERSRYLDREHYEKVFDRSGNATSTILLNGRVIGVWDFAENADSIVKLFFFEEVEQKVHQETCVRAKRIGEFMADAEVQVKECDFMIPLTRRTAGAVMSPLKDC